MSIVVSPLSVTDVKNSTDVPKKKSPRRALANTDLPTVFEARRGEESSIATLTYRRTQSTSECRASRFSSQELAEAAVVACIYQSIWEGRKRVEFLIESPTPSSGIRVVEENELLTKVVKGLGLVYEGHYPFYTKLGEDIDMYSWTVGDPLPVVDAEIHLGVNDKVRKYQTLNSNYYQKHTRDLKEIIESLDDAQDIVLENSFISEWDKIEGLSREYV